MPTGRIQLPFLYLPGPPARDGTTHGPGTYHINRRSRKYLVCLPIGQLVEVFYQLGGNPFQIKTNQNNIILCICKDSQTPRHSDLCNTSGPKHLSFRQEIAKISLVLSRFGWPPLNSSFISHCWSLPLQHPLDSHVVSSALTHEI